MIEKINLNNILFLDIETVPEVADFNTLDDEMKRFGTKKHYTNAKTILHLKNFMIALEFGLNLEKLYAFR